MRYNVHAGHCPDGLGASGAVGLIKESTEARKVKDLVIKYLKQMDHTVYDCTCESKETQSGCLNKIIEKCNAHDVDMDISIHFNSGANNEKGDTKSTGVEVYVYNKQSKAKDEALRTVEEIAKLGFKNRGVKYRNTFAVLKRTNAPAMLIEVCFVDDKDDVDLYQKNVDKIARAIVKGITGKEVVDKTLLEVNGLWDKATTLRAQEVFGTKRDGTISNQSSAYKNQNKGLLAETWEFKTFPGTKGSSLIKAMQEHLNKVINAKLKVNGKIDKPFIKAMQRWLGTKIDGKVSKPSLMVKAFQKWLNEQ